ncbi:MAG TPA: hypothetical protein VK186_12190 [Candidatus Deferrimicrobium sp.]|nr:hypothetical protein [Candidatus Deferrimicrobium sp.]
MVALKLFSNFKKRSYSPKKEAVSQKKKLFLKKRSCSPKKEVVLEKNFATKTPRNTKIKIFFIIKPLGVPWCLGALVAIFLPQSVFVCVRPWP